MHFRDSVWKMKSSMARMAQLLVKNRPYNLYDGLLLICNMGEPEVTRCQSTQVSYFCYSGVA